MMNKLWLVGMQDSPYFTKSDFDLKKQFLDYSGMVTKQVVFMGNILLISNFSSVVMFLKKNPLICNKHLGSQNKWYYSRLV